MAFVVWAFGWACGVRGRGPGREGWGTVTAGIVEGML